MVLAKITVNSSINEIRSLEYSIFANVFVEKGDYQNLRVGLVLHFLDLFVVKGNNLPAV